VSALGTALLVAAGLAGGTTNALAGGATFFTFPAMLTVGLAPVIANASNTVALWPASLVAVWAQGRRTVADVRRLVLPLAGVSVVGSAVGAFLLLHTSDRAFLKLVPFLLLVATALFAGSPLILRRLRARAPTGRVRLDPVKLAMMALVALYGGYFGAGIGILMLTSLSFMGMGDVHRMNAVKTILAAVINGVSIVVFVLYDTIDWRYAPVMAVASIVGGYYGAVIGRRLPKALIRGFVVAVGLGLAAYYFLKQAGVQFG
jgi:uncharacterized membrane protein YfcA